VATRGVIGACHVVDPTHRAYSGCIRIDHVIYGTADLDNACTRLKAEYGLESVAGGRHDGVGTHNRLVPLGAGYLEVLAIADPDEAGASPLGEIVAERIASGDGLIGWAVAVPDVAAVAARLGTDVIEVTRDGRTGRLTGLIEALEEPFLPFFIEREPSDAPNGISWIEVAGDRERLNTWLGDAIELPVHVLGGGPAVLAVGVGDLVVR
jgi:hypothetical protein